MRNQDNGSFTAQVMARESKHQSDNIYIEREREEERAREKIAIPAEDCDLCSSEPTPFILPLVYFFTLDFNLCDTSLFVFDEVFSLSVFIGIIKENQRHPLSFQDLEFRCGDMLFDGC